MHSTHRPAVLGLGTLGFVLISAGVLHAGQEVAAASQPALTPAQIEVFLLNAKVTRIRDAGNGVTASRRATLTDGTLTHDAHVQVVAVERLVFQSERSVELNFKDLFRYNIAAYRLAGLIGLDTVPISVERSIEGRPAAVTWWVDDVAMDEKGRIKRKLSGPDPRHTSRQLYVMRVWDELIQNKDRNQGNILWTSDWKMWLIDHTRAFRLGKELLKPDRLLRCERGLLERMRGLTERAVAGAVGHALTREEISSLIARRDLIVKHFDRRIREVGEPAVLFELDP
jgi:hypothetical protein